MIILITIILIGHTNLKYIAIHNNTYQNFKNLKIIKLGSAKDTTFTVQLFSKIWLEDYILFLLQASGFRP